MRGPSYPGELVKRMTSQALWKEEARLADALEVAGGVGTWDWDLKTDLIYANERFATLFNVDPVIAATTGAPSAEYISAIHPEDQHIVVDATQHAIATTGPYVVEFRLPQKSGANLWIYALGHAYCDEDGTPSRFPGAAMDITQRKKMEVELKIARDHATSILESITDGFFTLDQSFCFSYVNKAAEQILAARRENLVGRRIWDAYPELEGTDLQEKYQQVAREKIVLDFQWLFKEWDRWFSIKASPTSECGLSVYFRDITEERAREQELRRANRELEEFAFVASHDLQEPLRTVNVYTQLLMRRFAGENSEALGFADMIGKAVKRMELLIRDLLTYSRTIQRAEKWEGKPAGVADLSASLGEALSLLKSVIDENDATIIAEPLPKVVGDTSQLVHVFQNLLSNALKYRKKDEPLRIDVRAQRADDRWVIAVQDNGIGFSQKYAERIFGLFKRLHGQDYPGTGLGLAICQRVIERYGGRVWAESVLGEGSTFYFELVGVDPQ
jgi:PAS domain S-box-containing protein